MSSSQIPPANLIETEGVIRLAVDAIAQVQPTSKVVYFVVSAKNLGNEDMAQDGSVTPIIFSVGPPPGEKWYIFEYGIVIDDSGNNKVDTFGAINNGLANGLLIDQHIGGSDYTFVNLKNNMNIVETFSDHSIRGQANSFLNAANFYTGRAELRNEVALDGDSSDEIRVTVRDNLSGLDQLRFVIEGYKVIA